MTTMYNSSDPPGVERVGMGGEEGGSNGGERAPMPTGNLDITRALEDTANVLTAPDKVGWGKKPISDTVARPKRCVSFPPVEAIESQDAESRNLPLPISVYHRG